MKIVTDERCIKYSAPGHPEQPDAHLLDSWKNCADKQNCVAWKPN